MLVSGLPPNPWGIEYRLLVAMSVCAGQVFTHDHLLQRVWAPGNSGVLRPMRTAVRTLRRKLGDNANNPTDIFTESRVVELFLVICRVVVLHQGQMRHRGAARDAP